MGTGEEMGWGLKECGLVSYFSKHTSLSSPSSFGLRASECSFGGHFLGCCSNRLVESKY